MADILRFVLVDENDVVGDHEYASYAEAEADARKQGKAVLQRRYTYEDEELVWTPNGSSTWPPAACGACGRKAMREVVRGDREGTEEMECEACGATEPIPTTKVN